MRTATAIAWAIQCTLANDDQANMNMLAGERRAAKHVQYRRASGPRVGKYLLKNIYLNRSGINNLGEY